MEFPHPTDHCRTCHCLVSNHSERITDKQKDRLAANRQIGKEISRQTDIQRGKQTGWQANRQTSKDIIRQTDIQRSKQTGILSKSVKSAKVKKSARNAEMMDS